MADCLPDYEHHWVAREIGERGPDGLYDEPVLRFADIADEEHVDKVCIHCGAFQTTAPHPEHQSVLLYATYHGNEPG